MAINYKALDDLHKFVVLHKKELLIVTKKRSLEDILSLMSLGFCNFGENKVQEANIKYSDYLSNKQVKISLIGPLQSNKVKLALQTFDVIQSIDRKKIVDEIIKFKNLEMKTKYFFIQINIGNEQQKSGISEENLFDFYNYCIEGGLTIEGLMCIPPYNEDPAPYFKKMNVLRDKLNSNLKLSMGMSSDYKIAIKFNSDLVRVGSLLFNENSN